MHLNDRLAVASVLKEVLVNFRALCYPKSHEGSGLSELDPAHKEGLSGI